MAQGLCEQVAYACKVLERDDEPAPNREAAFETIKHLMFLLCWLCTKSCAGMNSQSSIIAPCILQKVHAFMCIVFQVENHRLQER